LAEINSFLLKNAVKKQLLGGFGHNIQENYVEGFLVWLEND
jgi:hypothetical protein